MGTLIVRERVVRSFNGFDVKDWHSTLAVCKGADFDIFLKKDYHGVSIGSIKMLLKVWERVRTKEFVWPSWLKLKHKRTFVCMQTVWINLKFCFFHTKPIFVKFDARFDNELSLSGVHPNLFQYIWSILHLRYKNIINDKYLLEIILCRESYEYIRVMFPRWWQVRIFEFVTSVSVFVRTF